MKIRNKRAAESLNRIEAGLLTLGRVLQLSVDRIADAGKAMERKDAEAVAVNLGRAIQGFPGAVEDIAALVQECEKIRATLR